MEEREGDWRDFNERVGREGMIPKKKKKKETGIKKV